MVYTKLIQRAAVRVKEAATLGVAKQWCRHGDNITTRLIGLYSYLSVTLTNIYLCGIRQFAIYKYVVDVSGTQENI